MIIHNVEQGTQEWYELRLGRVTGSKAKGLVSSSNLSLIDELIAEKLTGQSKQAYVSEAMERGTDLEPVARDEYSAAKGVIVDKYGFITNPNYPILGYSPDGLYSNETKGIEIKCPDSKKHIEYIRTNKLPSEYKWQIFTGFLVCNTVDSFDFISFDPRVTLRPLHIVTIPREAVEAELKQYERAVIRFAEKFNKYLEEITF